MIEEKFLNPLRIIYSRMENQQAGRLNWVITGSLGMALQGMELAVHDIDLQTDKEGAYEIERRFSEYVVKPVRYFPSERIRSHFGALAIGGVKVEIMGDLQQRLDDQTWEEPVKVELHKLWVGIDGMQIPVLSLEHEYRAYFLMGRIKKAEMLRQESGWKSNMRYYIV